MMAIERKKCWYYVVCVIALMCLCNSILAQTTTEKKATFVFRVPYGKELNTIGVQWADTFEGGAPYNESACGITVLPDGDITIGDFVQGKIKRFSPKGQLLGVTEGWAGVVSAYSTDSEGGAYICADLALAKYSKDGHFQWKKEAKDLITEEQFVKYEKIMGTKIDRSFAGNVDANRKGWLIVLMLAKDTDKKIPHEIAAIFDSDGKFVKFLPYFPFESSDLFWTYQLEADIENDNEPPGPIEVNIYSERGNLIKKIKPDYGDYFKQRLGDGGVAVISDKRDGFWIKCHARLPKPIVIKNNIEVKREFLLCRYDVNGSFLEELRLPYSPFMASAFTFTVANDGTLYYMQFDKDGINVMAYK